MVAIIINAEKKRKKRFVKIKVLDDFYFYKGGEYLRQKLDDKRGCKTYRIKYIKPGRRLLVCITDKRGPRGGTTKAVALLRDKDVDLREYRKKEKRIVAEALKKMRKLKEKLLKKND